MRSPSPRSIVHFCGLCLIMLAGLILGAGPSSASLEEEVARKNKELAEQKRQIQALTDEERRLHKNLVQLETSVQEATATLQRQETELTQLRAKQVETAKHLNLLLAEREKTGRQLEELLQTLWPIYLKAREEGVAAPEQWSLNDRKGEWLASMYREAQRIRGDIERQTQEVADQQSALDQIAANVAAQMENAKATRTDLEKKKKQYDSQIKEVRSQKVQSEREIRNLLGTIASLRHQISLQASRQISKLQGQLSWPAKGRTIVPFAPDAKPGSNGIGLSLTPGAPVRSISWGKVVHNDQLRGFGQVVIVFHGEDYYSLYAFLSDAPLPVGKEVERGQQIGVCGYYPPAKGDGLYFELRFKQKAINPLKWLQSG